MADTLVATGLRVQQWDDQFFREYFHDGRFKELMGEGETSIIQVKEDLTKKAGDSLTYALVNRLTNAATTGNSTMEGNEEDIASRSFRVYVEKYRNAVRIPEMEEQKSAIGLRAAARPLLMDWATEHTREQYLTALGSLNGTAFLSRTAAIADAWLVDNADRTVFGAYAAGGSAGGTDLSADLAQLDTTSDLFNTTALDAMILRAKVCNPKIRPMRDGGNGKRYYVALANPHTFKNLRDSMDTEVLALTNVEAQASKLFDSGDLLWNGCIVKEIDNVPIYANIGNGGTTEVSPVYMLGAQALAFAIARRWQTVTEDFDYGDKHGVETSQIYGIRKMIFGSGTGDTDDLKDHGVVTGFFATTGAATANGLNGSGTSAEV